MTRNLINTRTEFYGSLDIAVVDSVMTTIIKHKTKPTREQVRLAMLEVVSKFLIRMKFNTVALPPAPPDFIDWIDTDALLIQTAVAAGTAVEAGTTPAAPTDPGESQAKVEVLEFDQKTGRMTKGQVDFGQAKKEKALQIELPWQSWHELNREIAKTTADKASVVLMLETIHRGWDASEANVKIMLLDGKASAVAGANMLAKAVMLPACIPKGCKVYDSSSENPMAVPVSVAYSAQDDADDTVETVVAAVSESASRSDFLLVPEFRHPTAVAANPGDASVPGFIQRWIYSHDNSESMHAFWVVRRISEAMLQQEQDQVTTQMKTTGEKLSVPNFNCEIVYVQHTLMAIASVGGQNVNSARFISVPYICNVKDVVKGEELIVRHAARVKPKKVQKITWREVQKKRGG